MKGRQRQAALRETVAALMESVGLDPGSMDNLPHHFSGGQRQRIAIARALSPRPELIVLDEPLSALDVSVRAQVMNLLKDIQRQYAVSNLMITHDLATVRLLADRIVVMYLGRVVEAGPAEEVIRRPRHPYTWALISAATTRIDADKKVLSDEADVPSPINPPSGCSLHTRS